MAIITEEMARMVAELRLCYVATVTPDGKPNLSPKGSLCVIDGDHLAFADIMSPGTMRNLRSNPYIEVNMVHPFLRRGYRFKGRCEIFTEGRDLRSRRQRALAARRPAIPGERGGQDHRRGGASGALPRVRVQQGREGRRRSKVWLERYGVKPLEPTQDPTRSDPGGR